MWLKTGALAAALLLTVAACGGSDPDAADTAPAQEAASGTAAPSATTGPAASSGGASSAGPTGDRTVGDVPPVCDLLTSRERKSLVGKAVDRVIPVSGVGEGYTCRWVEAHSLDASLLVQVTAMPAPTWAQTLPAALRQMEQHQDQLSAADRKELARAKRLVSGDTRLGSKQACALFTTLSEIGGAPKGSERTVNFLPVGQSAGVSAQSCREGRFTSVVFAGPGLPRSQQVTEHALAVLKKAHDRAAKLS